jgi:hypothetical protein
MKTSKNEQKSSLNYPFSSSSFKKLRHYFHPDDDFREDHSWGEHSDVPKKTKSVESSDREPKHVN